MAFDYDWLQRESPGAELRWVRGVHLGTGGRKSRSNAPRHEGGRAPDPALFLVEGADSGACGPRRAYDPHAVSPPLYRAFAEIEASRQGVGAFAQRYGMLGVDVEIRPLEPGEGNRNPRPLRGESESSWYTSIAAMKDVLHLWDLYEREDLVALSRHMRWNERLDQVYYLRRPDEQPGDRPVGDDGYGEVIAAGVPPSDRSTFDETGHRGHALSPGDLLLPALFHLQGEINRQLAARNRSSLIWGPGGRLERAQRPTSLLNLLWMQMADEVGGKAVYLACQTCGLWVRVGPDAARTSRLYCSNRCRTRGLRRRQLTARERHALGFSVEAIAAELDSDPDTVSRWVNMIQQHGD